MRLCVKLIEKVQDESYQMEYMDYCEDDFDFVNLQVLPLPYENYVSCDNCILWINPKVWSTTPEKWGQGTDVAFRKWQFE